MILTHFVRNLEEMGEWMVNLSTPQIMINKINLQNAKTEKIYTNLRAIIKLKLCVF